MGSVDWKGPSTGSGTQGKSIGLAFFLVVAIKSNLSTIEAAKVQNKSERGSSFRFIFSESKFYSILFYDHLLRFHIVAADKTQHIHARRSLDGLADVAVDSLIAEDAAREVDDL